MTFRHRMWARTLALPAMVLAFAVLVPCHPVPSQDLAELLDEEQSRAETPKAVPQGNRPAAAVPSVADRETAVRKVREVFADELARCSTPDAKQALSGQLSAEADRSKDIAERWALRSEALRLSSEAGDVPTALSLIDLLAGDFATVGPKQRLDAMLTLAAKASPAQLPPVLRAILETVREVIETGDEQATTKALATVAGLARKAKDQAVIAEVVEVQAAIKERAKQQKAIQSLEEKLAATPNDPAVCLEVGKFFCFKLQDWNRGLPILVKGKDDGLAAIARQDLASEGKLAATRTAGDAWWEWAEEQPAVTRDAARLRAAKLYEAVVDTSTGLDKTKLEKRIATALTNDGSRTAAARAAIPGLILWLDASVAGSVQVQQAGPTGGPRVARWRDLSGKGHDAIQPDQALQPEWRNSAPGKTGAVVFDGRTTLGVNMPCDVSGTIIAVVNPASNAASMRVVGSISKPGEFVGLSLRPNGIVWAEASSRGVNAVLCQSQPGAYTANQAVVIAQTWGKALMVYRNAAAVGPETAHPPGIQMRGPWGVGGATLALHVEYFSGEILEVLVLDRELPPQDVASICAEKMRKWRIP